MRFSNLFYTKLYVWTYITTWRYRSHGLFNWFIKNFKVKNVIFNCGESNKLELELINVIKDKKIKYYSCIKELNIDNINLKILNTRIYDNENDNSTVIYFIYNNYKFLFMGDSGLNRKMT